MNWSNRRVVILGAARQGTALARYLAANGARVVLSDQRPLSALSEAIAQVNGAGIEWAAGGHPLELLDGADVLCISGGVPLTIPVVAEAVRRGIPLSNDSQIFLDAAPCPVIGITGSAGKTTTTTLTGRMAQHTAQLRGVQAWIGGNIGNPLLNVLGQIGRDDLAVMELSSFQLEIMTTSPQVAVILNITPNHLDRHGTMQAYTGAKANILRYQSPASAAILGRQDRGAWQLAGMVKGTLYSFGESPAFDGLGSFVRNNQVWLRLPNGEQPVMPVSEIILPGAHNRLNVLAACAIAAANGWPVESMRAAVTGFRGVPHRLELVRTINGVDWINDSIATAPERTIAALHSFERPLVLLLGGRDKNLPWQDLLDLARQRVEHVVLFGEISGMLHASLQAAQGAIRSVQVCPGLEQAVQAAAQVAEPGSAVLLSPGGTSFDEFHDFEERGERFRQWVNAL